MSEEEESTELEYGPLRLKNQVDPGYWVSWLKRYTSPQVLVSKKGDVCLLGGYGATRSLPSATDAIAPLHVAMPCLSLQKKLGTNGSTPLAC